MKRIVVAFALLFSLAVNTTVKGRQLEEYLPSGSTSAAIVEIKTVLDSPLYAKVAAKLPKLEATAAFFEQQFPIPRQAGRRLIVFGTAGDDPGALLEVADFPEAKLADRLDQTSFRLRKTAVGSRNDYIVTIADQYNGSGSVVLTYLTDTVILLAENSEKLSEILALAPMAEAERTKLLAGYGPELIAFATSSPDVLSGQEQLPGSASMQVTQLAANVKKMTAKLQFQGEDRGGLLFNLELPFDKAEEANQFVMGMNMVIFIGIGALSAEQPELAQQLMQNIRLKAEKTLVTGRASLSDSLTDSLLDFLAGEIDPYLVTPQEAKATGDTATFRKSKQNQPAASQP